MKPRKAAGLEERADQIAREIVDNLNRHRREKEEAAAAAIQRKKHPSTKSQSSSQ